MNKTLLLLSLTVICLAMVGVSCSKDEDPSPDIYGSWIVLQTDSEGLQFLVELRFNSDNTYDWLLVDTVPTHSNSHAAFELNGRIMTIVSDADCSGTGRYYVTVDSHKLSLLAQQDDCQPRANALEYIWDEKPEI